MNKHLVFLIALLALFTNSAQAQTTRYITDEFEVTLRSGESTGHSIIRMLKSGTALEVLQTNPDTGYTKVRANGVEGYVITRYLMPEPAGREQFARAKKRIATLELENKRLASESGEVKKTADTAQGEQKRLEAENRKLRLELSELKKISANAVQIDRERKDLQNNMMELERQLQTLAVENESLKDRTARDWFMVGAGVLLFGILTGWIASRTRWKKRTSWDTL